MYQKNYILSLKFNSSKLSKDSNPTYIHILHIYFAHFSKNSAHFIRQLYILQNKKIKQICHHQRQIKRHNNNYCFFLLFVSVLIPSHKIFVHKNYLFSFFLNQKQTNNSFWSRSELIQQIDQDHQEHKIQSTQYNTHSLVSLKTTSSSQCQVGVYDHLY